MTFLYDTAGVALQGDSSWWRKGAYWVTFLYDSVDTALRTCDLRVLSLCSGTGIDKMCRNRIPWNVFVVSLPS